jgi:N-acetyl-gamma-glutamylphosphate reductase
MSSKGREIEVYAQGGERLKSALERHPFVCLQGFEMASWPHIEFRKDTWIREAWQGHPFLDGPYGLPELMDNNPLICADRASCPGPAATLALIALGPSAKAGLLRPQPSCVFSFEGNGEGQAGGTSLFEEVEKALEKVGWSGGVICAGDPVDYGGCLLASAFSEVSPGVTEGDVVGLYDEIFGRSFFVRRVDSWGEWVVEAVRGKPYALYHVALQEGGEAPVLRVQVSADAEGKAGGDQLVHLMNIMAGFEEDLGLLSED